MKKITLAACIAATALTACTKDSKTCIDGDVRFTCTSDNPYRYYIDGVLTGTLNGHTFADHKLSKGTHNLKAEQVSGYVLYPTVRELTISVQGCDSKEFIFP